MQKKMLRNDRRGDVGFSASGEDYSKLTVVNALGSARFYPSDDANLIKDLIGATVINFGMPDSGDVEGGGLIVDYLPKGSSQKRLVFAFNDSGMWVEFKN